MTVAIGPGDAVATLFRNGADAVAATFGVMMTGAVEVPINPALSADDSRIVARWPTFVCCSPARHWQSMSAPMAPPSLSSRASSRRRSIRPAFPLSTAARQRASSSRRAPRVVRRARFTARSGAGQPNILLRANLPFRPGADSNVLLMTPFSHGSSLMTHAYLSSGASVTLLDGVDPPVVLDILHPRRMRRDVRAANGARQDRRGGRRTTIFVAVTPDSAAPRC